MKKQIPIFFAVDDNYVPQLKVALSSLMEHASKDYNYIIYILNIQLSNESRKAIRKIRRKGFKIVFYSVESQMENLAKRLNVRDYYTMTTYYRLILPKTFFFLKKAIYLDSDILVRGDISELYNVDMGDNYVAAVPDASVQIFDEFIQYVEKALEVPHEKYFNAGILVMNLQKMREIRFENKVENLVKQISFKVAQDQDLLNVICKDHVKLLNSEWNTMPLGEKNNDAKIIHYNLILKPWKQDNIMYEELFWAQAGKVGVSEQLIASKNSIPDFIKEKEKQGIENVKQLCLYEIEHCHYYKDGIKHMNDEDIEKSERSKILAKIEQFEREGKWDKDVEDDPPYTLLKPGDVDYLQKHFSSKCKSWFANHYSFSFFNKMIKKGDIVVDGYEGVDVLRHIKTGAVITSNHFNPFDSIPIHKAVKKYAPSKKLFKVIREGNYTFPGLFGFFMRHCNTLPLAADLDVMKEMLSATNYLLTKGNFVLVYAEQSMWWNYRKPKPLKMGAFKFAAKAGVPVIPSFITMRDTDKLDKKGYPIQGYTLHIFEPIYPDMSLPICEAAKKMKIENERIWKECYEKVYGIPLTYTVEK